MIVKRKSEIREIIAGDGSMLREILHPDKDDVKISYSVALARVGIGKKTLWHKLDGYEIYHIIRGMGKMFIDDETEIVSEGDTVVIPPDAKQRIENIGNSDLVFLCIVEPPWKKENEKILER